MEEMDIRAKMNEITENLIGIDYLPMRDPNKKSYDKTGFVFDLESLVNALKYFYDTVVPEQECIGKPTKARFPIYNRPAVHQVAYFNLTRGFPKELFGGHLCYVVKDLSAKYLVIPTTSVKENRPKTKFEIDIKIKDYINDEQTRLQVSDMRCIDKQRLYTDKLFFDIETDKTQLINQIKLITGLV